MSSRTSVKEHKESHKHEKGYTPTAQSHGIDRSMVAHGNHEGSAPKGGDKVSAKMAADETTALDDERGTN
ncbi:hypothetical protein DIPPA_08987 [Diplonema papillatum]|nr:hypothetical protein DIPPA_08987 [Diplonema papillatum]